SGRLASWKPSSRRLRRSRQQLLLLRRPRHRLPARHPLPPNRRPSRYLLPLPRPRQRWPLPLRRKRWCQTTDRIFPPADTETPSPWASPHGEQGGQFNPQRPPTLPSGNVGLASISAVLTMTSAIQSDLPCGMVSTDSWVPDSLPRAMTARGSVA